MSNVFYSFLMCMLLLVATVFNSMSNFNMIKKCNHEKELVCKKVGSCLHQMKQLLV